MRERTEFRCFYARRYEKCAIATSKRHWCTCKNGFSRIIWDKSLASSPRFYPRLGEVRRNRAIRVRRTPNCFVFEPSYHFCEDAFYYCTNRQSLFLSHGFTSIYDDSCGTKFIIRSRCSFSSIAFRVWCVMCDGLFLFYCALVMWCDVLYDIIIGCKYVISSRAY